MPRDTALILGASKGLGAEIVAACHRHGWHTIELASSLTDGFETGKVTDRATMRPANYGEFMDPAKVAGHIVRAVAEQRNPYLEQEITRDSPLGQSLR